MIYKGAFIKFVAFIRRPVDLHGARNKGNRDGTFNATLIFYLLIIIIFVLASLLLSVPS